MTLGESGSVHSDTTRPRPVHDGPAKHPWTCVVSYHTDPDACGVARFGAELAQRIGVPMVGINYHAPLQSISSAFALYARPLFSLKWAELSVQVRQVRWHECDVLWHDMPTLSAPVTGRARGACWSMR